jgi:hypothetical protein
MTDEMKEALPQEQQEAQESPEQQGPPRFTFEDLAKIPGAPTKEQIDAWKAQFGTVYVMPFSPNEAYVWRYLTRGEWMGLMGNQELVANEAMLQSQIVQRGLLWPKLGPLEEQATRAGLIPTLFGVIMQGSYFLAPEVAVALCDEL